MSVLTMVGTDRSSENAAPVVWGRRIALTIGLLIGLARLCSQGFGAALQLAPDLRPTYLSASVWVHGGNPYSASALAARWEAVRGPGDGDLPEDFFREEPSLYPPPTLVVMAPLTLLPWNLVRGLWLAMSMITTVLAWIALVRVAGMKLFGWRAALLGVIWLEVGPLQTLLHLANPTLLTVNLMVFAVYFATFRMEVIAAVVLAIAVCLKPQLGGALLVYYALGRRWRLFGLASGLVALISCVAVGRLTIEHSNWLPDLLANLHMASGNGGLNDPNPINPFHWRLLNLQFPLFAVFSSRTVVSAAALLITGVLCVLYLICWRRAGGPGAPEPLAVSVPLLLALLPVYHSYYDALLLVFPLAWVMASLGTSRTLPALMVLFCTWPFYICAAWAMDNMIHNGSIPRVVADSTWFNLFVFPCETWMLILLSLVLMACLYHRQELDRA